MGNWDEKLQNKLKSYSYEGEPTDNQVRHFFHQLEREKPEKTISISWAWRMAAAFLLLSTFGLIVYQVSFRMITTRAGETISVRLPDGSNIRLNAASSIRYNALTWQFARTISLEGEGFFEVEKGPAFTVHSSGGTTRVLGTSFNVKTRNSSYEVKCYSGKVAVEALGQKVVLTPGKAINTVKKQLNTFEFEKEQAIWVSGEYHFSADRLESVLAELSRSYGLSISIADSLEDMRYTGYFPTKNLDLALKLVCDPLDLTWSRHGDTITMVPATMEP